VAHIGQEQIFRVECLFGLARAVLDLLLKLSDTQLASPDETNGKIDQPPCGQEYDYQRQGMLG